ncbi:MAG: DUF3108 domain-containing protein [Betaproteobacteria bacterium]
MSRHIRFLSVIFCFISASVSAQALTPKHIQATYEVTKNGMPFAKVHEQMVITGNTYKVESITKGIGIYALFGERKLTSIGELTSAGLKPTHFELQQGDNPKKALIADFDWSKSILHMLVKGAPKDAELALGTQDLASYAYQFMFLPAPLKNEITVTLTTGKKLNQYVYKVSAEQEMLALAGTQYKTLHLLPPTPLDASKPQETKELWLATEYHYVPVRILMVDENGQKLEQTLSELHVE